MRQITIEEAVEIVKYCPEISPDISNRSCVFCPLFEVNVGLRACEHIREAAHIIEDTMFL